MSADAAALPITELWLLSPLAVIGAGLLLAQLIGLWLHAKGVPKLYGAVCSGLLLGVSGLGLIDAPLLSQFQELFNAAAALVLFEVGRKMDLAWLWRSRREGLSLVLACLLRGLASVACLLVFGLGWGEACLIGAILVAVNPIIFASMAFDSNSSGVATNAGGNMVGLSNLIALLALGAALAWLKSGADGSAGLLAELAKQGGKLALGGVIALLCYGLYALATRLCKAQAGMLLAALLMNLGLCSVSSASALLSLLLMGIFLRNAEQRDNVFQAQLKTGQDLGYALLFTVFGMHVHVGVPDADEAIRICAWLTQRAPLFIALSANSPCWQGEDSGFCSSRSNVVGAFPMSGTMPPEIRSRAQFQAYFERLAGHGIVNSIKDFYWDVRPKPEYGTVELRVLDTPLKPAYAASLACYARELCIEVFSDPGIWPADGCKDLYAWNRFNAAKDGVDGVWIDPEDGVGRPIAQVVANDLKRLSLTSTDPDFGQACRMIDELMAGGGQARWLTAHLDAGSCMNDLARVASEMFDIPAASVGAAVAGGSNG